jgi:hypothetical protein
MTQEKKIKLILDSDEEATLHCALTEAVKWYTKYRDSSAENKEYWEESRDKTLALLSKLDNAEEVDA